MTGIALAAQEVYAQLKAREERVRRAEAQQAEDEAEALRRLHAREESIEATLAAREACLAQQVPSLNPFPSSFLVSSLLLQAVPAWISPVWQLLRISAR